MYSKICPLPLPRSYRSLGLAPPAKRVFHLSLGAGQQGGDVAFLRSRAADLGAYLRGVLGAKLLATCPEVKVGRGRGRGQGPGLLIAGPKVKVGQNGSRVTPRGSPSLPTCAKRTVATGVTSIEICLSRETVVADSFTAHRYCAQTSV